MDRGTESVFVHVTGVPAKTWATRGSNWVVDWSD